MTIRGGGLRRIVTGTGAKGGRDYTYTPKDPTVAGTRYGLFDGTDDVVTLGDPWTLTIDDPWTIAMIVQFNGGTGTADKFFWAEQFSPAPFGVSIEVGSANAPKVVLRNQSGNNQYLESQGNLAPTPFGSWGRLVIDYDGSRTNAGLRMWVKGTAATMTQVFNNLSGTALTGSTTAQLAAGSGRWAPHGIMEYMLWEGGATDDTITAFNAGAEITEAPTRHINFDDTSGTTVTALQGSNATLSGDDGSNFWKEIA